MMSDAIRWYDQNISDVSRRYESVAAETVHGWLVDLLPNPPALVLDVGAGTGRDAAWLASRSLEVVAIEPSGAMSARFRWGAALCAGMTMEGDTIGARKLNAEKISPVSVDPRIREVRRNTSHNNGFDPSI
jgi:SAM-dependent methyltransferase